MKRKRKVTRTAIRHQPTADFIAHSHAHLLYGQERLALIARSLAHIASELNYVTHNGGGGFMQDESQRLHSAALAIAAAFDPKGNQLAPQFLPRKSKRK